MRLPGFLRRPSIAILSVLVAAAGVACAVRHQLHAVPLRQQLFRGMELAGQGRMLEAERSWKEALRLDSDYWPAWKLLAQSYALGGRWSEARDAWQRVSRLAPRESHVRCELATACWTLGDEVMAREAAEAELQMDPRCVPALSLGAQLAAQTDDQKRAIAYLRRALRVQPKNLDAMFRLASLLVGAYRREEARALLQRMLREAPEHADAHGLLGLCYLEEPGVSDSLAKADYHLSRSLEMDADSPDGHLAMARLRRQQGRFQQALEHLDAAIVLDPYRQRAHFERARVCEALGQHERAEKARQQFLQLKASSLNEERLAKLCAIDPNGFDHHLELGLIKLNGGDLRRAEAYLRRALELRPAHAQALAAWKSLQRARAAGVRRTDHE